MSVQEKSYLADYVIFNNGTEDLLAEQVTRMQTKGVARLEPLTSFITEAREAGYVARNGDVQEIRQFHQKIGSNLLLTDPPRGVGAQSAPEVLSHETAERRGGSASRAAMGKPKASFFPLSSGHELLKQNGHLRSVAGGSSSFFVVSDAPASVRPVAGKPSGKFLQKSPPWLIVGLPSPWNIVASTPRCLGWWTLFKKLEGALSIV